MHLIGIDRLNWIFTYVIDEVKDYYFLNYIQSLMAPRAKSASLTRVQWVTIDIDYNSLFAI